MVTCTILTWMESFVSYHIFCYPYKSVIEESIHLSLSILLFRSGFENWTLNFKTAVSLKKKMIWCALEMLFQDDTTHIWIPHRQNHFTGSTTCIWLNAPSLNTRDWVLVHPAQSNGLPTFAIVKLPIIFLFTRSNYRGFILWSAQQKRPIKSWKINIHFCV